MRRIDPVAAREIMKPEDAKVSQDKALPLDLDPFFDSLCSLYLGADGELRLQLRNFMGDKKRLLGNLQNYAGRAGTKLKDSGNPEFLKRGVAAACIDDGRSGQDYVFVLKQLHINATNHGLQAKASKFFSLIAPLCSDETLRGTLESFQKPKEHNVPHSSASGGSSPELKYDLEQLCGDIPLESAISLFLNACNKPDTLFITEQWIVPRLEYLRRLMSDPIFPEEAEALRDAAMKRARLDDFIEWLAADSAYPWQFFNQQKKQAAETWERMKKDQEREKRRGHLPH